MEENKNQRPLIVEIEDAKMELTQCINNIIQVHKLPCYLIEPIIAQIYNQIKFGAQSELNMARKQMKETE